MRNKTALITGSYGGLGSCLVNEHAALGGNLILVGRSIEKLEAQKKAVEQKYRVKAHVIAIDLTIPNASQQIYDTCKQNGWTVDYLINNAGFGGQGDFTKRTMAQDMSMIQVNIEVPTQLCKLFIPDFVKRGNGKVLNVSSTAAMTAGPLQACYYATKAYVTSWSNALWRELKGTGVTVTCLMPGALQTGFANASDLADTKLFAKAVSPKSVAKIGYKSMLKGKLNITAGLVGMQKILIGFMPLFPKKMLMNSIYNMQVKGSAKAK